MGENGYIYLKLNNFRIDADGTIYHNPRYAEDPNRLVTMRENDWEEEEVVDRLRVVDFEEPRYLRKQGNLRRRRWNWELRERFIPVFWKHPMSIRLKRW